MSYHYPPGWGPPYQGGPPPMPSNISVNQRQWQMGSWQFNPAYNWQRHPVPQMQWMAAPSWRYPTHGHYRPVPADFNPYKKPIRPPSAEYLAMKVSANGLDLHNMVPAENRYGDEEDPNVPKTPWIWNPATLSNDAPSESAKRAAAAAAQAANDRAQNRSSSAPLGTSAPPARPRHATDPSSSSASASQVNAPASSVHSDSSPLKPTFSSKIIRTPAHYVQSSNASSSTSVDSLAGRMEHLSTSRHSSLGRQSSMPSVSSNSNPSSSISGAHLSDEPLSILSPLVIPRTPRTPTNRPVSRGATYPNIGNNSGLEIIPEVPRSHERPSHARQTSHQMHASQTAHGRPMPTRSESYPRDTTLQDRDRYISQNSHSRDPHRPSVVQQHTPPDIDSYPGRRETALRPESSRQPLEIYAPTPPPQTSHSSSYTATRSSSFHPSSLTQATTSHTTPRHSPPDPSAPTPFLPPSPPSHSHDYPITPVSLYRNAAPVTQHTYEEERPKPVKPFVVYVPVSLPSAQGRRSGYWNRRGDHCTDEGYLVFAPPELAHPPELSTYPEREYQSHVGDRIAFDPKRPELPESLPRHGKPPEKPYKDVRVKIVRR